MLLAILAGVVAARAGILPGQEARPAAAMVRTWDSARYNVMDLERPGAQATAGSASFAELDSYFLSREPTAKHERTGLLAGQNLVLLVAEDWQTGAVDSAAEPALRQMWEQSARFPACYAPDWYQGMDGRLFALLSGLVPTAVGGTTSLAWTGEQNVSMPFALGSRLQAAGYDCAIYPASADRAAAFSALGFPVRPRRETDASTVTGALETAGDGPFAICVVLTGTDGEPALAALWQTLEQKGLTDSTAVCLLAGSTAPLRGLLLIRGRGLAGTEVSAPCSELDVTPTLLDLMGVGYDARFLSGRDLLADGKETDVPVSLYGSAFSDWVSASGSYSAGGGTFQPAGDRFSGEGDLARYVQQARQTVYDRYVFAQRALESNYFRVAAGK